MDLVELENIIHEYLNNSVNQCNLIKGKLKYYHYNCDNFNDVGWGCGYRTTQTICSWIREQINKNDKNATLPQVPTILEMQKILTDSGDKPSKFVGSQEWIGCFESCIIIDTLYDVPCKILTSYNLKNHIETIFDHFTNIGSPIMMGGDLDNASKAILGIKNNDQFLVVDPHFKTTKIKITKEDLIENEWVSWRNINQFDNNSFYNFCMPQLKFKI